MTNPVARHSASLRRRAVIAGAIVFHAVGLGALGETPRPVTESRGVWVDKREILEGRPALAKRLDRLVSAGFNTLYVATQVRGAVMYPRSRILPQYADAAAKDPRVFEWLIPEVRRRGLRVEAWVEFGFYAYWTQDASVDSSRGALLNRYPELTAIDRAGRDVLHHDKWGDFYSLCPSNPRSQDILIRLYEEVLDRYHFDGINLDRIRYPNKRFCHCPYCKTTFQTDTGLDLTGALSDAAQQRRFVEWRKQQLTKFVERLSSRLRTRFPAAQITSAVVPPSMINDKGQDWPTWLERGYLDAVMPMLYEPDLTESLAWIQRRLGDHTSVFAGIDAGLGSSTLNDQIAQLRSSGAAGVTVWHAATVDRFTEQLRKGLFARPAISPLQNPARP